MKRGLLIISALLMGAVSWAEVGRTAGLTLSRLAGARAIGMGEAFVSVDKDIQTMNFNPAGMGGLEHPTLTTTYKRDFAEASLGAAAYGHSFKFGSVFVGGGVFDAGSIELNQSNGFQGTVKAQQDTVVQFGLALGRTFPVSVGVAGKYLDSELAETAKATTFAVDTGLLYRALPGLNFGVSMQNMGSDLTYEVDGDPLPRTLRYGMSYGLDLSQIKRLKSSPYLFLVTVDGVNVKEEGTALHAGFEFGRHFLVAETESTATLRGGYRSDGPMYDVGIGFKVANVLFDYSLHLISDLDIGHRFTLGYRFAPSKERPVHIR